MRPRATLLLAAVVALGALLLASCTSPRGDLLPPPSSTSTTEPAPATTEPDYSRISLSPLPGETTVPPLEADGRTTIRGSVSGPDGAVAGAIVRIQRLVGDQVQQTDVQTDENGGFSQGSLPGGRFRVRAFQEPGLTTMEPEVFYLADGDDREVRFTLDRFDEVLASAATTPSSPMAGQGVNLAVRIARQSVDDNGVVQETPIAGVRVRISSSGWTLVGDDATVTDDDGVAVFEYRCERAGSVTASAVVGEPRPEDPQDPIGDDPDDGGAGTTTTTTVPDDGTDDAGLEEQTISLDVPDCASLPATTTTTTAPSEEDDDDGAPTTTQG